MSIVHYNHCPVCNAAQLQVVLTAEDHTVSHEKFAIAECGQCTLRFTQDVPDAASVGPYYKSEDYISHTNTSKGLINSLYQWVRKRTMTGKRKLVQEVTGVKQGHLLDVGSGTGSFANEMKQHGWTITGLEPDEDARAVAKQQYQLELSDTSKFYQLPVGSYDAITMWHVLEHVHDMHAHFSPRSLQVLMEKHGLKVQQYKPMWYDSFYISLLSSKYKNGKSNLIASFFNGLRSNMKAMGNVKRCSSIIYIISK
jgi:SAM-dependent methyltransferase